MISFKAEKLKERKEDTMRLNVVFGVCILLLSLSSVSAQTKDVSRRKPDGLILSTGNLYFTSHDAAGATVWRTSQLAKPGQEALLYREPGAKFGDITFAKVDGRFFGYFFATRGGAVQIKRVPLTGGQAIVLASVGDAIDIENTHHNLLADGVNLYWQNVDSILKMPIRGGAITVLDTTDQNTPTAGIELQNGRIIYASLNAIRFVPTAGASSSPLLRTIATASSGVSALHAVSNGVYWGERNGPVRRKVGTTTRTLSSSTVLFPNSISTSGQTAGGLEVWTACNNQGCRLRIERPFFDASIPIAADAFGVSVTSSRVVFWGDAAGIHRRAF
jgi:hypothetical protein